LSRGTRKSGHIGFGSRVPIYLIAFAVGDFYIKEDYNGVLLQYAVPRGERETLRGASRIQKK